MQERTESPTWVREARANFPKTSTGPDILHYPSFDTRFWLFLSTSNSTMPPKQAVKQTQPPAVARGVQPGLTTTNRGFGDRRDAERQEPEYRQAIRPNDTIPKWRFYPGLMIHAVHHKEDVTQGPDGIDGNGWARNTNLQNGLGCYSKRRPFIVIHVFMETVALLP